MKAAAQSALRLTNLDKLYWKDEGISKGDLIAYYDSIADLILPYLKDRPQSLNRYPEGIDGFSFYQKDVDFELPTFVETKDIYSESNKEDLTWLLCNNRESLLYIVNLGCIEINPWNARVKNLDKADYMVIDLDPDDNPFEEVIDLARQTRKLLDRLGIESYCKTSGKTGLHVYVPLGAKFTHEESRAFAKVVVGLLHEANPENTGLERSPAKRRGLIYLDWLQNRAGSTLASAYSVRPAAGAPVSTPLKWTELRRGLTPAKFTIFNTLQRTEKVGDLWTPVIGKSADMSKLKKLLKDD